MTATTPASGNAATAPAPARWYQPQSVERGAALYARHCAGCHGHSGEGAPGWRERPMPPPLNGTGHAWHHPLAQLGGQIKFGTPGGGTMRGFSASLTDQQILDTIAWFQSQWPDRIYAAWMEIELRSRKASQ